MSTRAREVGTVHSRAEAAKPSSPRQVKRSDRKTDPRKPAADLLALQRKAGNRAVTGLLAAAASRKVQRLRGDENLAKGGDLWHAQGKHYKIVEVREEGKKRFLLEEVAEAEPEVKAVTPALPPQGGDAPPLPKGAPPPPSGNLKPLPKYERKAPVTSTRPPGFVSTGQGLSAEERKKREAGRAEQMAAAGKVDEERMKQRQELWVLSDDPNYFTSRREAEAARAHAADLQAKEKAKQEEQTEQKAFDTRIGDAFGPITPAPLLPPVKDYDFAWWFNYMWSEARVADMASRAAVLCWAEKRQGRDPVTKAGGDPQLEEIAKRFEGHDDKAILEVLLSLGFLGLSTADTKKVADLSEGEQGEKSEYFKVELPALAQTGLVYRSDSRAPDTIRSHGGSKARSHLSADKLAEVGLDQNWNPFSAPARLKQFWLRLGMVDNDLQTVVSLAVDPRDAVKFPLPGSKKSDGSTVSGGKDEAHLYVVWIRDKQVIDTSAEIQQKTGASRFGRGELGALDVPYGTHLVHILTERYFQDNKVDYVAGKVKKVELIQPDATYLKLPDVTRLALFKVVELLTGGQLGWLVHKPGYKEANAEPEVEKIEKQTGQENKLPDDAARARTRRLSIDEKRHMQPQRDALEALSPDLKELGLELLAAYDWAVEQWASGKGSPELIGALDQKMKPTLSTATEMQRLRRGKTRGVLVAADDPTPIFELKNAIEMRERLLQSKIR